MKLKSIFEHAIFLLSVPKCVCCGAKLRFEEKALCSECKIRYDEIKTRNCSLCSNVLSKCKCSNKYLESHYVKNLLKVYRYAPGDDIATNRLIYSLKRDDRSDVFEFLSAELRVSIENAIKNPEQFVFTNVPRRKKSISKYGVDHSGRIAKTLAKTFSAEYYQPLVSKNKRDQKKNIGSERMKNLNFFYKKNAKDLSGKRVIIVDDVVTTGASLGTCAAMLRGLGAKEIVGATISIAFKDQYTPFKTRNY